MLALSALPVFAGLSISVDYGLAHAARGRLDNAASSAATQATSAAADAFLAGSNDALHVGIAAARARFTAQTASQASLEINPVQIALSQSGGMFNATVSYTANMSTTLARMIGISSLPISGQASASFSYSPPVDLQVLMDISSSMTYGATPGERAKLEHLISGFKPAPKLPSHVSKGEACGFACHWSDTAADYYQLALKNHVILRITALQDAVTALLRSMDMLDAENRFQVGLYGFDQSFHVIHPLSHDLGSVLQAVGAITPNAKDCTSSCNDTSLPQALEGLATADAALPRGGDSTPQRYLFIVTDGLQNNAGNSGPEIKPIVPSECDRMKALGFSIIVLYLPYPALPGNAFYNQSVAPIVNRIAPGLQGCASTPAYFFEASDPSEMTNQLQNMLRLALRTASHPMN